MVLQTSLQSADKSMDSLQPNKNTNIQLGIEKSMTAKSSAFFVE